MSRRRKKKATDSLASIREALSSFYESSGEFIQEQSSRGELVGSQFATEKGTFARPESLVTAVSTASFLVESGGEHICLLVKAMTAPVEDWPNLCRRRLSFASRLPT